MKATFLILTYNQEDYIEEALNAAFKQTYRPLEILICDDASTDGTASLIEHILRYAPDDIAVKFVAHKKNLGFVGNLNQSILLASGEVIVFAPGDDVSYPERTTRIVEKFKETNALLVHSHAKCKDLAGNDIERLYSKTIFTRKNNIYLVSKSRSLYLGASGAWHRDLFEKYGLITAQGFIPEDLVFGYRAYLEDRIGFIDEELLDYRVGSGITTRKFIMPKTVMDLQEIADKMGEVKPVLTQRLIDINRYDGDEGFKKSVKRFLNRRIDKVNKKQAFLTKGFLRHSSNTGSTWPPLKRPYMH
nr:glycosyltransferase [Marinicella sp. W31]MDC2879322.1 glycosyltransferase [Marinicella sp. W31]